MLATSEVGRAAGCRTELFMQHGRVK